MLVPHCGMDAGAWNKFGSDLGGLIEFWEWLRIEGYKDMCIWENALGRP